MIVTDCGSWSNWNRQLTTLGLGYTPSHTALGLSSLRGRWVGGGGPRGRWVGGRPWHWSIHDLLLKFYPGATRPTSSSNVSGDAWPPPPSHTPSLTTNTASWGWFYPTHTHTHPQLFTTLFVHSPLAFLSPLATTVAFFFFLKLTKSNLKMSCVDQIFLRHIINHSFGPLTP